MSADEATAPTMARTLDDNPWLDKSDIQDLRDAVLGLTRFLQRHEQRHQHAINRLSQADVITQLVEAVREVRDATREVRDGINALIETQSAR